MDKKEKPYAVFLSYNSEDSEAVEQIAQYLEKSNLCPWLDKWNLIPGQSIVKGIEDGLGKSSSCAIFIGKNGFGPWHDKEKEIASIQQIQDPKFPVIPIFLPDAPQKPGLPHFLSINLAVDFRGKTLDDDDALWRLECGIRGTPPGKGRPPSENEITQKSRVKNASDEHSMEFVDRIQVVDDLKQPGCPPYILLSAPAGYGKSRLLKKLYHEFTQEGWLCLLLELPGEHYYSIACISSDIIRQIEEDQCDIPDKTSYEDWGACVGNSLAHHIGKSDYRNILLLIDRLETLEESSLAQLLESFIPALQKVLNTVEYGQFRIILAGRYIDRWEQDCKNLRFKIKRLKPFSFSAVQESVQNFFEKTSRSMKAEYEQEFVSRLLACTGGHPGCMAAILHNFSQELLVKETWNRKEEEYYTKFIQPVIEDIRWKIYPEELRRTFEILSAVRRFHPPLLRWFIDKKIITAYQNEYDLENALLQKHLIDREANTGFLKDGIVRRLLAIYQRKLQPEVFTTTCEEAIEFYTSSLKRLTPLTPKAEVFAIEFLFQHLQHLKSEQSNKLSDFFSVLDEILTLLAPMDDMVNALKTLDRFEAFIRNDWEFRFTLNYLLCQTLYDHDHPFNEFIEKIDAYREQLQGGERHA
ncbi:methyltransferase type 11 [Candidatus Vecturithrix granuli]|uniref:Methyltransferase type 11 n=1 Tax=Vecturithrix granuli TaxID=1499967 RepID=A0A081BYB0_VECG1|nr:methyltransferase type 11 [Candidatus Vecturithrix granuli]